MTEIKIPLGDSAEDCMWRYISLMGAGKKGRWTRKQDILSTTNLLYSRAARVMTALIEQGRVEQNEAHNVRVKL